MLKYLKSGYPAAIDGIFDCGLANINDIPREAAFSRDIIFACNHLPGGADVQRLPCFQHWRTRKIRMYAERVYQATGAGR